MAKKAKKTVAAKAASASVLALVAGGAERGYNYGNSRADAAAYIAQLKREAPQSDYLDGCVRFKAGRIVSYIENPPKAEIANARNYLTRRWDNLDMAARIDAAIEMMGKASPDSAKPNRRTAFEHKACRAADTALSEVKKHAGIVSARKGAGGRPARTASNPPETSVTIAAPKFSNDADAREYVSNVMAALVTMTEINSQTGAPKSVKGVMFKVQSILTDAKAAIAKALNQD